MDQNGNKPKTKIHKPGIFRNLASNANCHHDNSRRSVFTRRDSTPELGVNSLSGLSFRREKRSLEPDITEGASYNLFTEVPSYNLWKSRPDRRSSLPNCLAFRQRKISASSGVFVPSVITRETKGIRKYSTSLRGNVDESHGQKTEGRVAHDEGVSSAAFRNMINVLPRERPWKQMFSGEHPRMSDSSRSYCDSVSTIRCSSTEIPVEKSVETPAYYAKNDSIKRWLNEVE